MSNNEKKVLNNNPKLAVLERFDEETLIRELEVAGVKVRWEMWSNPEKFEQELGVVEEQSKTDQNVEVDMNDVMSRQVYDFEQKRISFIGRRATDCRNNTHVYLPRAAVIKRRYR